MRDRDENTAGRTCLEFDPNFPCIILERYNIFYFKFALIKHGPRFVIRCFKACPLESTKENFGWENDQGGWLKDTTSKNTKLQNVKLARND